MPTLPWTPSDEPVDGSAAVVVMGSQLVLASYATVPGFLRASLKVRRQVLQSPGALGVSLIAQPMRKTFWTLSAWTDQGALQRFVAELPHAGVMVKYGPRLTHSAFQTFMASGSELPARRGTARDLWAEARRLLASAPPAESN